MKFNFLLLLISGLCFSSCNTSKEKLDSTISFKEINLSLFDESLTKEFPDFKILINDSIIVTFENSKTRKKKLKKTIQLPLGKCTLKIQTDGDSIALLDTLTISSQKGLLWIYYNAEPTKLQFDKYFTYKKFIAELYNLGKLSKPELDSLSRNLMLFGEINDSIIGLNKELFKVVKNENEERGIKAFSNRDIGFSILYHQRMTL